MPNLSSIIAAAFEPFEVVYGVCLHLNSEAAFGTLICMSDLSRGVRSLWSFRHLSCMGLI